MLHRVVQTGAGASFRGEGAHLEKGKVAKGVRGGPMPTPN